MTIPTVHMNGTNGEDLLALNVAVSDALEAVFQAMKQASPNGRDYYTQGVHALPAAIAEHESRMRRVDEIKAEVDALCIAISDQT